jgi:hypothetical protein
LCFTEIGGFRGFFGESQVADDDIRDLLNPSARRRYDELISALVPWFSG